MLLRSRALLNSSRLIGAGVRTLYTADNEPYLMIPGPVQATENVMKQAQMPPINHIGEVMLTSMSSAIKKMRAAWKADDSAQPFILAGSGTLAMEIAMQNLLDKNSRALVLSVGYFGDRFEDMVKRIDGVDYHIEKSATGEGFNRDTVEALLEKAKRDGKPYTSVYCTHVDTSVGVRTDVQMVIELAKKYGALSIVDGVAGAIGEEFHMSKWGCDLYLTGSQKALGMHAGISLFVASANAMQRRQELQRLPPSYMDFEKWKPIMQNYENGKPSYFATPATSYMPVVDVALGEVLTPSIENTWAVHKKAANAVRKGFETMGLEIVAKEGCRANTLTAFYVPGDASCTPVDIIGGVKAKGFQLAGPLLQPPQAKPYVRFGHMGLATTTNADLLARAVDAVQRTLTECKAPSVTRLGEGAAASAVEAAMKE